MKRTKSFVKRVVWANAFSGMMACFTFVLGVARAADGVWSAAGDGDWSVPANWEGGTAYAAGVGATAYFTNGVSATVRQDLGSLTLGNLTVANASILFTNNAISLNNSGSPAVVTVEGNSVTANVSVVIAPGAGTTLVKEGTGTLHLNKPAGTPVALSGLSLNGGLLLLDRGVGGDGLNVGSGSITINSGTTLRYLDHNLINNFAVVDVKSGGVLDPSNFSDNIGALTGSGTVTNLTQTLQFWLNGATRTFSGQCYGGGTFSFLQPGTFVVGASNSLENVTFELKYPGLTLAFAPGVGTYMLGGLVATNNLVLEDLLGGPVTLELVVKNNFSFGSDLTGAGGLSKIGSGTVMLTNTLTYSGMTTVKEGSLLLSNGTLDERLPNSVGLMVGASGTLTYNTSSSQTNRIPIYGSGKLNKEQASTVALNTFSMTNATVTVNGGTLAVYGGSSTGVTFTANNSGTVVEVNGGTLKGGGFAMNSGSRLMFNGGSSTGATLTVVPGYPVEIRGGTHLFDSALGGTGRYLQSGGTTFFKNTLGNINTNPVFVTVSGGTMNVGYIQHCQGLGLQASGQAVVNIANSNTRIASDGKSHTLLVTNDASVTTDGLILLSHGSTTSTGTIALAGGTLTMKGGFAGVGTQAGDLTFVNFDGGLLRFVGSQSASAGAYNTFNVFERGARIEASTVNSTVTFYQGLTNATGGSVDGGLVKTGPGALTTTTNNTYTGSTLLKEGILSGTVPGGTPFGYGPVYIGGGTLNVAPAGSGLTPAIAIAHGDAAHKVSYGPGCSALKLSRGSHPSFSVTLGKSDAAVGSVLARTNSGVLAIMPNSGMTSLGVTEKLLVNGGVAIVNGMASATLFGVGTDAYKSCDFLTYDAASGFTNAIYVTGLAAGAASVANVSANTTADNAQVYALRVHNGATVTVNSGKTLTVGDGVNPAGVILNNSSAAIAGISGGTLDFGASEGVVLFNLRKGSDGPKLSSVIAGSNGLTLAGGGTDEDLQILSPSNIYSGATRIMAGRVSVSNSRGFSNGDVYVYGNAAWGGQFHFKFAGTMTNTFHLSGVGAAEATPAGAIRFVTSATVSGPAELMADTRVGVPPSAAYVGTFSGPIFGPGSLEVGYPGAAWGKILLTGNNTYGGITQVSGGTLEIGAVGALAAGPIVNNAVLIFSVNGDMTVTNEISGSGRLVQNGSGTLTLTNITNFTGLVEVSSGTVVLINSGARTGAATVNGLLDLNGQDATVNVLAGSGVVSNSSVTPVALAVGMGDSSSRFWGTIRNGAGAVSLVKTGAGTFTLSGLNTYSGDTVIGGGTIKLQGTQTELLTNGLAYRLDAMRSDLVTCSGSNVTMWADATAAGVNFTQSVSVLQPIYVTNAVTGLPALRFNGMTNCMGSTKAAFVQTAFVVNTVRGYMGSGGLWGQNNGDFGIRQASLTSWNHPGNGNDFSCGGRMFINAVETNTFPAGQPHVLSATALTTRNWATAVGDCRPYNGTLYRSYNGDVNEVLVYSNALSISDHYAVSEFLRYKWLGTGVNTPTNVLPTATSLVVSNSAALDLNGISQAVGSLSGAGSVLNGSAAWSTLTVGNDNSSTLFSGTVSGSNMLVKVGSGSLTLGGANTYLGDTFVNGGSLRLAGGSLASGGSLMVASGATFDLGSQAQTLSGVGGSGTVVGDGLTVSDTIAPGGVGTVGVLTVDGTPTFDSCALQIDTRLNGSGDALSVSGDLNLSGLTLQLAAPAQMAGFTYEIITCAGSLSGTFAATPNLPKTWLVRYDYTPGAGRVTLVHDLGTILLFK